MVNPLQRILQLEEEVYSGEELLLLAVHLHSHSVLLNLQNQQLKLLQPVYSEEEVQLDYSQLLLNLLEVYLVNLQ